MKDKSNPKPEAATILPNVGEWPSGLHRRVKAAAANEGKTIQAWVIAVLSDKVGWKP